MWSRRRSVAGQANHAHGGGNADARQDAVPRANGPAATQAVGSAPRPPATAIVIRPTGTFNNAREVLDWLGVHHQLPEAQRYDCFAGGLTAGIPARLPAPDRGVQLYQGADYPRRQSYAVPGHPPHTAVPTAEGQGVRHDHKHVGRAPPVATVTGKQGAQENAAPGPAVVPDGKGTTHGAPASSVAQNAAALVAHGVPASAGTLEGPHRGAHAVQEPHGATQLRPSGSAESFQPDSVPVSAPAGGFFSWIPKIFAAPDDQAPDQHIEALQQTKASSAPGHPIHAGVAVQTTTEAPSTITYGSDEDTDSTTTSVTVEGRPWEARSLCCVLFGMLLMPTCLFVLSYYLTPQDVGELPPFTSPTSYTGSTSSMTRATLPFIFPSLATPSTADPWSGVSPQCFNSRAINDNISGLNLKAYKAFGRQSSQKIFCLYNNSRFLRGHLYDFVPENLPLDYCSYIVYWSVAVANASASSRAQQFDAKYGLWRLRQVLQKHKLAQKVGVLMALGGYPEDGVHFSRLGRDPPVMGRFVSSVIQAIHAHKLNGLTIHWVASQVSCRSADDERTMSTLVSAFREAFWLNGWTRPSKLITAILPADQQFLKSTATSIVGHLDFAFFETHLIRPRAATLRLCIDVSFAARGFMQDMSRIAQSNEKICAGISMTPWVLDFRNGSKLATSASRYTAVPGTASLFEVCTVTTLCLDTSELFCNVLRIPLTVSSLASSDAPSMTSSSMSDMTSSTAPGMNNTVNVNSTTDTNTTIDVNTTVEDTTMDTSSTVSVSATTGAKSYEPGAIVFHNEATLIDMLFHGRSGIGNFCVLLYDLDMDNYDSRCPATGTERVSLTQLDAAINIPPLDSLRVAFPPC